MVAVVSGSGLGLFNGTGAAGNSNVGRGRDQVFVNTTTGNLVVQSVDDTLASIGLDFAAVRTYNSQGLTDEDNNDQWRLGVHQRIYNLTGTVNTAGSTITKVFGDGAEIVYTWNTTRSRYESNDGDGANDFLTWNSGNSTWTWIDGSARSTEEYGLVSGVQRIKFSRDADGNTVTYNYTGSLLTSLNMAGTTAQTVNFTYSGNNLTVISVVSNGVTQTLTRYFYDPSNRLKQVVFDLTPENNTAPLPDVNSDGYIEPTSEQTYITTYTYDGSSKRIASITQTDGSSASFTYQNLNGEYRLATVTDAENRVTTFTYSQVTGGGSTPASAGANTWVLSNQDTTSYPRNNFALTTDATQSTPYARNNEALSTTRTVTNTSFHDMLGGALTTPTGNAWGSAATLEAEPAGRTASAPQVAFDSNGDGFAIWAVTQTSPSTSYTLNAARYTRSTGSWAAPVTLYTAATGSAPQASLAVDAGGNAIVAWLAGSQISAARYTGGSWGAAATVVSSGATLKPTVAISGNFAAVIWGDGSATSRSANVSRWTGSSWTSNTVDSQTHPVSELNVAVDSLGNVLASFTQIEGANSVACVWTNQYRVSTGTWSGAVTRDPLSSAAFSPQVGLDANGNGLMAFSQGAQAYALRYTRSTNTWSAPIVVDNLSGNVAKTSLAVGASGNAVLAWIQSNGGVNNVYAAIYNGATATFGPVTLLESLSGAVTLDSLKVSMSGSYATAVWIQNDGTRDNAYAATYNGTSWATAAAIEGSTNAPTAPTVAIDSLGNASALWIQSNGTAPSLYMNRFTSGAGGSPYYAVLAGATWQSIANAVYGVNSTAAGAALQAALGNPALTTGAHLTGFPDPLPVTTSTTITVPLHYKVPAGASWQSIANAVYGINSAAAGSTLQAQLGNPALVTDAELTGFQETLNVTTTLAPHYLVLSGASWQSIAAELFGSGANTVAGGSALQAALSNPSIAAGERLYNIPTSLPVTTTVPYYYTVQSGDTWSGITQSIYNTTDANAVAALQAAVGTTTLVLDARLTVPMPLNYTTGGSGGAMVYQRVDMQDALGRVTTHTKDAQGRLLSVIDPAGNETRYNYDPVTGNVATITVDPNGLARVTTFTYDPATGLLLNTRDSLGNTVARTYDSNNQLLTEKLYTDRDPDGGGAGQPLNALTTRYIYDAGNKNHLRFVVSADGRVTEHIYDTGPGLRLNTFVYASGTYSGTYDEASLNTWATNAARRGGPLERTDYAYDFRGNLSTLKRWAATNSSGDGTGPVSTTRFVYDQRGLLLSTVEARGEASSTPTTDYVTTYTYDGFGRRETAIAWVSDSETARPLESTTYDDVNRKTVTTFANGLIRTLTFNRAGELISVANGPSGSLGTTNYTYDAGGRLRVVTDPTGIKNYSFYDGAGQLQGTVDGDGSLVEFIYNRAGQLIKTVRYATGLSATRMTGLSGGSWSTVSFSDLRNEANVTPAANQITRNVYDASGALVYSIDQIGAVSKFVYDGAGRLTDQIRYRNLVSIDASVNELLPAAITISTHADDRTTRYFYNADGRQIGTLDGAGYLTESFYDAAGRLTKQVGYYNAVDPGRRGNASIDTMRPGSAGSSAQLDAARDISTRIFYDAQGRRIGSIDGERYFTELVYDVAGNVLSSVRYDLRLNATAIDSSFSAFKSAAASAPTHTTTYTYDGLGQVLSEINFENTPTTYAYDLAGNVTSITAGSGVNARTTATRYDVLGRITEELTAEGYAALAALSNPTQVQINTIWSQWGVKYTYDNAGRRTSATVRPDELQTNTTYFYYDADNRLRFELDPRGRVTENRYNALGQLVDRIQYYRTVSITSPAGGLLTPALISALTATESANVHEKTTYGYTLRDQVSSALTAAGATQVMTYNAFGELETGNAGSGFTAFEYTYDTRGLQKLTRRGGVTFEDRTYDAFGRLATLVDVRGNTTTATFDRLGRIVTTQQPGDANSTLTTYDGFSRVLSMRDKLLNTTSYVYNDATLTVTITTPENIELVTVHNVHGEDTSVVVRTMGAAAGTYNTTTYQYNKDGRLTSSSDSLGVLETRGYDRAGRQVSATDARETLTSFEYDAANRILFRRVDNAASGLQLVTSYQYDTQSRVMTVTEPGSRVTRTEYDRDGRVSAIVVDPNGTTPSRTEYTYDAASNNTLVIEGAGSTKPRRTKYVYDSLGRRAEEIVDPTEFGGTLNLRTLYKYDNNNNVTRKIDAKNNSTWYVYDAQDRLTQTIDALGGVTQLTYDSEDRVIATRRFFNTVSTGSFGDTPAQQSITATVNDHVTRTVFDRDGRAKYTLDTLSTTGSPGSFVETAVVTERSFDANGNVTRTRIYRNAVTVPATQTSATLAQALTDAGNSTTTPHVEDRIERTVYDLRGRVEISIDGSGAVTRYQYDANGNVTLQTQYAATLLVDTLGSDDSTRSLVNTLGNAAKDRVTRFWYDTLDRARFSLDAEGYLVQTKYLDSARQEQTIVYAGKPTIAANAPLTDVVTAAGNAPGQANNQVTTRTFDVAGRVVQITDANNYNEYFAYDAVGNKIRYVNKKAASATDTAYTWTYEYDANHRLTYERSPNVSAATVNSSTLAVTESTQQLVTHYLYDALGNVTSRIEAEGTSQARTTSYEYDLLGRQTATVSPTVGVYSSAGDGEWGAPGGAAVTRNETSTQIRSETAYDVFGNAFRNRVVLATQASNAANGLYTYKVYDGLGRVKYEIDAKNQVTSYGYDAFGNKQTVTRHAAALSSALPTTGNSVTLSQVSFTADAAKDRTITTTFDRLNRAIVVKQPSVRSFDPSSTDLAGPYYDAQPTTENVYNAFGEVVRTRTKLNAAEWATTYFYFDKLGCKKAELDPVRYLTLFEYDETGDLTRQVEYARPTTGTVDYDSYGTIVFTNNGNSAPGTAASFAGYDRESTFTYDKLNRLTSESKRNLEHADIVSGNLTPHYDGIQVTTYGYDVLGNQTLVRVTNPDDGSLLNTYTFYDVLGRIVATAAPARNLGDGTSKIAYTRMLRDGHGNLVQQIEYYTGLVGNYFGGSPVDAPALPATPTADANNDRKTTIVVDAQGQALRTRDATGADRFASYDIRGNVAKEWQTVVNPNVSSSTSDDITETIVKLYRYDAVGQQVQLLESQRYNGANTDTVTRVSEYNAFGEIISRYNLGTADDEKQYFDYDAAGRVWRTNAEDGIDKVFMYDLAGNATLELRSKDVNLNAGRTPTVSGTYGSAQSVLSLVNAADLLRTVSLYDAKGQVIERRLPTFDVDSRFQPAATDIQLGNVGGSTYLSWVTIPTSNTLKLAFGYRALGSTVAFTPLNIVALSGGRSGVNVDAQYGQLFEFRLIAAFDGEPMPFAESMGSFRFDRATSTSASFTQVSVDPASQVAALNASYSGGFITWTAPSDTGVTARMHFNGGAWIDATRPTSTIFQIDVRTALAGAGTYTFDIEYRRGSTVIAGRTGQLTSSGNSSQRQISFISGSNNTAQPFSPTMPTPQPSGTGAGRTLFWGMSNSTTEGAMTAEIQYRRLASDPWSSATNVVHNGSGYVANVASLDTLVGDDNYNYQITFRLGNRVVGVQNGQFNLTDARYSNTVSIESLIGGGPPATTPISSINGVGASNTASWNPATVESEMVAVYEDDGTATSSFQVWGQNKFTPNWTGSQSTAWVVLEYDTLGGIWAGSYTSTSSNSVHATWARQMTRGVQTTFSYDTYTGWRGEFGPVGVQTITRIRVYTSQGGTLIADSQVPPRGITWNAPGDDLNITAKVFYETTTNNWTYIGDATRTGNSFTMIVDAIPNGQRRIKVEYYHPGESWAFQTAIANINQATGTAPVISGQVNSNHDAGWVFASGNFDGRLYWSGEVVAGGRMTLELKSGSSWSALQTWTSGSSFSYDYSYLGSTTPPLYEYRITYYGPASSPWVYLGGSGSFYPRRIIIDEPANIFVTNPTPFNQPYAAAVIAPTMSASGLSWNYAKLNGSDTIQLRYTRAGQTYTDTITGSGPAYTSIFPQLADMAAANVSWTLEYLRAGETNSYARATGITNIGIATNTIYATIGISSQSAAYPSTVQQISLPNYRASDRAIVFTTPANSISDIQFLFDGSALTVTAEPGGGYRVFLPAGASGGAHSYSIRYQGAGNPYATTSGTITVTNTLSGGTNFVLTNAAQRAETSMSISPGIGQGLVVWPPNAVYHSEWGQGIDPNTGQVTSVLRLVEGARAWGPESVSGSGGFYYTTYPSEADPDGAWGQYDSGYYIYDAERLTIGFPATGLGVGATLEYWPLSDSSNVKYALMSNPSGGAWVADLTQVLPGSERPIGPPLGAGNYGYRISLRRQADFAPIGVQEGTFVVGATSAGHSISGGITVTTSPLAVTPTSKQSYDRWGNVVETIDAAGNLSSYRYNGLNLLVQTLEAMDNVYDKRLNTTENSVNGTAMRAEKTNSYDLLGRLIETQDGYDQATRVTYNGAAQQINKRNADYARHTTNPDPLSRNVYDVFGNLLQTKDEIGYLTRFKYDRLGRLTDVWREIDKFAFFDPLDETSIAPSGTLKLQHLSYRYDEAGRRVAETNGANETVTYQYDFLGNVTARRTAMGHTTTYRYDSDSRKISEIDPIGSSQSWLYDGLGRLKTHGELYNSALHINDANGDGVVDAQNVITYNYNEAGQIKTQTSTIGQNITYKFDRGGNLISIVDKGDDPNSSADITVNRTTNYRYDAAGRQVRETVIVDDRLHQDSRYRYDAHNRIIGIDDSDYGEKIIYDVNGNRAIVRANYPDHNRRIVYETISYKYDEMNRLIQSNINPGGDIAAARITDLTYNARGERVLQVAPGKRWSSTGVNIWSDTIQGFAATVDEEYRYDGVGRLTGVYRNLYHTLSGGQNPTNIKLHEYIYDLADRRMTEFHRTMESGSTVDRNVSTSSYDADGRAISQLTEKWNSQTLQWRNESRVTYGTSTWNGAAWTTGYDDANNLRQYTVQAYGPGGGETILSTFKNTYLLGGSYLEKAQDVTSTGTGHPDPGHTERSYNVNRELVKFKDTDPDVADQTRYIVNNQAGQVLTTIQGNFENASTQADAWYRALTRTLNGTLYNTSKAQYFFFAQGNQFGSFGQIKEGSVYTSRFDVNATPISEAYPAATPATVVTQAGDTLRVVAARVFGDASLWYVIAEENGLTDPDADLEDGMQLRIPNQVVSLSNNSASFKPFDVSQTLGDTTPSQPAPPPPKGCGVVGMIIMIVVMIVVTIFTAGVATAGLSAGFSAIMSAGAATLAAGFSATALVAGAVGSIASQGVGVAMGMQDKIDWGGVALSAIGTAVGAGIGKLAQGTSEIVRSSRILTAIGKGLDFVGRAGQLAIGSAVTQGIGVVTGLQKSFSWREVAVAAVGSVVSDGVGSIVQGASEPLGKFTSNFLGNFASNVSTSLVRRALGGRVETKAMLTDSFGNALINSALESSVPDTGYSGMTISERISANLSGFGERNFGALGRLSRNPVQVSGVSDDVTSPDDQAEAISRNATSLLTVTASDGVGTTESTAGASLEEIVVEGRAPVSSLALDPFWLDQLIIKDRPFGKVASRRFDAHNKFVDEHMRTLAGIQLTAAYAYDTYRGFEDGGSDAVNEMTEMLSSPEDREALAIMVGVDAGDLACVSPAQQLLLVAEGTARSLDVAYSIGRQTMAAGMGHNPNSLEARFLDLYRKNFEGAGSLSLFAAVANGTPVGLVMTENLRPQLQQDVNAVALAAFAGLVPRGTVGDVEAYATDTLFGAYAEHVTPLLANPISRGVGRIPGVKKLLNPTNAMLEEALTASLARASRLLYGFAPKALSKTGSISRRLMYVGRTPTKTSEVGLKVQARMMAAGTLRTASDGRTLVLDKATNRWRPLKEFDMGHITDAVHYWNSFGRYTGARSAEVRGFMENADGYTLLHRSVNRSAGAKLRAQYLEPASAAEIAIWRQRHRH